MDIEIEAHGGWRIDIRWSEELGLRGGKEYRDIAEALEELPGVEEVIMGRYSAVVKAAIHVIKPALIGTQIELLFMDKYPKAVVQSV